MMENNSVCLALNINHVAIAVTDIEKTITFYQDTFGIAASDIENIEDQGVRATLIKVGNSQLEIIQPINNQGSVSRFIEKRGEGLHHICFEVANLQSTLDKLAESDIRLIDSCSREGLSGMIAFLHPQSTGNTLIELVDENTTGKKEA